MFVCDILTVILHLVWSLTQTKYLLDVQIIYYVFILLCFMYYANIQEQESQAVIEYLKDGSGPRQVNSSVAINHNIFYPHPTCFYTELCFYNTAGHGKYTIINCFF